MFNDMADPRSTEDATNIHGLFGAIIVEAPEAKWFDPETGEELTSGLMADIYQPGKPAFREYSVFFHDELEVLNKEGEPPIDPHTGLPSMTTTSGGWRQIIRFQRFWIPLPSVRRNVIRWIFCTEPGA